MMIENGRLKPLRRTRIRVKGVSTTAELKEEIQGLVREIVMLRDKGCILKNVRCGNEIGMPGIVWQADHLISRSNSATFADTRLIVCICKNCHGWKSVGSNLRKVEYDELVKKILSKERLALWNRCEVDSWRVNKKGAYDWGLEIVSLKNQLNKLKNEQN